MKHRGESCALSYGARTLRAVVLSQDQGNRYGRTPPPTGCLAAMQFPSGSGGRVQVPSTDRGAAGSWLECGRAPGSPSRKSAAGLQTGGAGRCAGLGGRGCAGWGSCGSCLTTDCCLQVREESRGQRPLEDEFPDEQLGGSCRSVLPRLHPSHHMAPDQKLMGTPTQHWRPKLYSEKPFSKSSPLTAPSLTVIASLPVVTLWLW